MPVELPPERIALLLVLANASEPTVRRVSLRPEPGTWLRLLRAGNHTQCSLARALHVSGAVVRQWKGRGIPSYQLPAIARHLGLRLAELMVRLRGEQ